MAYSTLGEAVEQVARHMSLINSEGVTPYSPDLVISYLNRAYEHIKDEQEWGELTQWYQRTLDGATGRVTEAIPCTDWKRIQRVYHESFITPLPMLSNYANPLASTLLLGVRPIARGDDLTGDNRYLVNFYPLTLTGSVLFHIELSVDWTDLETVLPIDWWLHVDYASWAYALDDGTNPSQISKYETSFNNRMKQMKAKENSRQVLLQPNQVIPNEWFEEDAPYA
jgi:hypothetical protein